MALARRTLLRASAIGLAGSIAGCAGASENRQQTETTTGGAQETTASAQDPEETIVLGGQVEYWYGVAPSSLQGRENPALTMEPGTVYEVVWVNLDGVEHELRLFDGNDEVDAATESASEAGESRSVVLEATEQLARYDCEYHPERMRGQVRAEAGETTAGTTTTTTEGGGGADPY
jgi:plastocyanin